MKLFKTLILTLALCATPLFAAETVNINNAGAQALAETLQNVGPVKAKRIVAYRKAHGDFKSIEALVKVKGIGLATVEDNRDAMTVDSATEQE